MGPEQAFQKHLPLARQLPADRVVACRHDVTIAAVNVKDGVEQLMAEEKRIRRELPTVNLAEIEELIELSIALSWAQAQVERAGLPGTIRERMTEGMRVRALMLAAAEALALAGVIPEREVARIRSGHGMFDTARDCVELAGLFTAHAEQVSGKTTVSAELIEQATVIGTDLLHSLRPMSARRKPTPEQQQALDDRDRLWTLVQERHRLMRRIGTWLWDEDVDAHVPALLTYRNRRKAQAKETPETKPAPQPQN
jgi:hypothetical protein